MQDNVLVYEARVAEIEGAFDDFFENDRQLNVAPDRLSTTSARPSVDFTVADNTLANALTLDENRSSGTRNIEAVTTAYLAAAENYLTCISQLEKLQISKDPGVDSKSCEERVASIKQRVSHILDRVSSLKTDCPMVSASANTFSFPIAPQFKAAVKSLKPALTSTASKPLIINPNTFCPPPLPSGTSGPQWEGANKLATKHMLSAITQLDLSSEGGLSAQEIAVLKSSRYKVDIIVNSRIPPLVVLMPHTQCHLTSVINGRVFHPWLHGEADKETFRY